MGNVCGGDEPVQQPRQRKPQNPQQQQKAGGSQTPQKQPPKAQQPTNKTVPTTPSAPIGGKTQAKPARDEIILGSSVSERDQFTDDKRWKELLDRTTTTLIDVSQNTQPLEGADAAQRAKEHTAILSRIGAPQKSADIFDLPEFEVVDNLSTAKLLTQLDQIFMQRCCQELSTALSSMAIEHKGDIVVSFDVLGS